MSIDTQNARQIRDPMQIEVSMTENTSETATLSSASGYSVKVANYQSAADASWQMKNLADLQNGGFPLDGSCHLYAPETDENGKIGIRGDVGQPVGIHVQSSKVMARLSVEVSGCSTLSMGGTVYDASTGYVLLQPGAKTADLILSPATSTERIEVSFVVPAVAFHVTNEDIISCTLDLRSDLQPIDPTLPESEITVEIYSPNDVSEVMADVVDSLPITYSAGYTGDMSPVRHFYLSEQATWEAGVLTIHGTDAVDLLEKEIDPFFFGRFFYTSNKQVFASSISGIHGLLYQAFTDVIRGCGIDPEVEAFAATSADRAINGNLVQSVIGQQPAREIVANMVNLLHHDYAAGAFTGFDSYWLTYVDAGRPKISWSKPTALWTIREEDCGEIHREIGRKIGKIVAQNQNLRITPLRTDLQPWIGGVTRNEIAYARSQAKEVGSADIFKGSGVAIHVDGLSDMAAFVLDIGERVWKNNRTYTAVTAYAGMFLGLYDPAPPRLSWRDIDAGRALPKGASTSAAYGKRLFSGDTFVGWGVPVYGKYDTINEFWNRIAQNYADESGQAKRLIESGATSVNVSLYGSAYDLSDKPTAYSFGEGVKAEASETGWKGVVWAGRKDGTSMRLLPDAGVKSLQNRNRETGSFTWKGDPRMQPRDVFRFVHLDGTEELRTIESISLKHEGGGTTAEIVYRKGVV